MLGLPGEPLAGQRVRAYDTAAMVRYVKSATPRTAPGSLSVSGSGGSTRRPIRRATWQWPLTAQEQAWPWKVYNTTKGSTGQVQINGGDGFTASLNSAGGFIVAKVNGTPNNEASGNPLTYPQLAISGNGIIYAYAQLSTSNGITTITSLDVFYGGSVPYPDTQNPATYYSIPIATISNYTTGTGGKVSFTVGNGTNYGYSQLIMCLGVPQVY